MSLKGSQVHSNAWVFQAWATFIISIGTTLVGINYLPVDNWIKGYMGMGLVFSVGSTLSLAKTTRDIHESSQIVSRIDEARVEQLLAEHHPLKVKK
ncbi:MAG TPA: hypothetical protein DDZ80_30005 [Cyanobacteria bacterium UBA8803]|nr:hypothetical protein [Cyanobacteria bacterium UBA9273]HBL62471.1 hypothetical protein [Cyanobacteria bacterium UBA8803]